MRRRPWPAARPQYGVLLRPVTVDQIRATADEGALMPPKSTFFWPKLRTGLVFRDLVVGRGATGRARPAVTR